MANGNQSLDIAQMHAARPEMIRDVEQTSGGRVVEKPLTLLESVYNIAWVRKVGIILAIALAWQIYGWWVANPLLFPTLSATLNAFWQAILSGELLARAWVSMKVLLIGYAIGIALASLLTMVAIVSQIGNDFLDTVTSMFNPLPAIALLPLALIWFGLGMTSIVFVLVHAVLWPVALNTHAGFKAVSNTQRMVGRNAGLTGIRYVTSILIPGAFGSILTGLKIGWAFGWRTLIAAELVFGVSSGSGGLGWYIYLNKNVLRIPEVFAGLLMVILIGLLVENVVFRNVEARTVRKWGMHT